MLCFVKLKLIKMITERIELNGRVRTALDNAGWKQNEFADLIGMSYPQLSNIFNAQRTLTPFICLMLEKVGLENAEYWMAEESKCKLIEAEEKVKQRIKEVENDLKTSSDAEVVKIRQQLKVLY